MKNKPLKKNWDDVKMVIATLAITSTLGFWYEFSRLEPKVAAVVTEKVDPPRLTTTQVVQNTVPVEVAKPGIIYFQSEQSGQTGLTALSTPQTGQKITIEPSSRAQNRPARPDPVTTTRSSR